MRRSNSNRLLATAIASASATANKPCPVLCHCISTFSRDQIVTHATFEQWNSYTFFLPSKRTFESCIFPCVSFQNLGEESIFRKISSTLESAQSNFESFKIFYTEESSHPLQSCDATNLYPLPSAGPTLEFIQKLPLQNLKQWQKRYFCFLFIQAQLWHLCNALIYSLESSFQTHTQSSRLVKVSWR